MRPVQQNQQMGSHFSDTSDDSPTAGRGAVGPRDYSIGTPSPPPSGGTGAQGKFSLQSSQDC
jgi:hypothetical protein